jgi:hypothetical protein
VFGLGWGEWVQPAKLRIRGLGFPWLKLLLAGGVIRGTGHSDPYSDPNGERGLLHRSPPLPDVSADRSHPSRPLPTPVAPSRSPSRNENITVSEDGSSPPIEWYSRIAGRLVRNVVTVIRQKLDGALRLNRKVEHVRSHRVKRRFVSAAENHDLCHRW